MAKTKQPQAKRESPVFLKGVYFRHYEDLVETAGENKGLRYFAEVASRSGLSFEDRINYISGKFDANALNSYEKRVYAKGVLNSLTRSVDSTLRRKDYLGTQRGRDLAEAKSTLTRMYDSIAVDISVDLPKAKEPQIVEKREEPKAELPLVMSQSHPQRIAARVNVGLISGLAATLLIGGFFIGYAYKLGAKAESSKQNVRPQVQQVSPSTQADRDNQLRLGYTELSRANSNLVAQVNSLSQSNSNLVAERRDYSNRFDTLETQLRLAQVNRELAEAEARINANAATVQLSTQTNLPSTVSSNVQTNLADHSVKIQPDTNIVISTDLPIPYTPTNTVASTNVVKKDLLARLGSDLDQYRIYSVDQGSRSPMESAGKTKRRLVAAGSSLVSTVSFAYANDKFVQVREDDLSIKQPAKSFWGSVRKFFRELGGPITNRDDYRGLNPLTGFVNWGGDLVVNTVGVGKNTVNLGTLGLANNVIEPAYDTSVQTIETGKHFVQAGLNTTRVIAKPLPAKGEEVANQFFDWTYAATTEFGSNVGQGEGYANAQNIQKSINQKGNTGVIAEFGASAWLLGKAIDGAFDHNGKSTKSGGDNGGPGAGHNTGSDVGGAGGVKP